MVPGAPCGSDGACPTSLVCAHDGTCELPASDAPPDGALPADAPTDADAPPPCAQAVGHDEDADGLDDACDNCPADANPDQADSDYLIVYTTGNERPVL